MIGVSIFILNLFNKIYFIKFKRQATPNNIKHHADTIS